MIAVVGSSVKMPWIVYVPLGRVAERAEEGVCVCVRYVYMFVCLYEYMFVCKNVFYEYMYMCHREQRVCHKSLKA